MVGKKLVFVFKEGMEGGREEGRNKEIKGWGRKRTRRRDFTPHLSPSPKVNSKRVLDLNIRAKTMKHLEENMEENLCDLGFCKFS